MTVKTVGKAKVALGLEWNPLTDANAKNEAVTIANARKKALGALYEDKGEGIAQIGLTANKKHAGAIAAAAALAMTRRNALVVQAVSKDNVWVCFVKDSEVIVGYDFVTSKDEAKRVLNELFEAEEDNDPLEGCEIISDQTTINFLTEIVGDTPETVAFEDLFLGTDLPFPKGFSKIQVKPLKSNLLFMVGGTVVALCAAGYFYVNGQVNQPQTESMDMSGLASLSKPVKEKKTVETTVSKEEAIALGKAEESVWIKEIFETSEMSHAINMTLGNIDFSNLVESGWRLNSVTFNSNPVNTALIAKWVKEFGEPTDFKKSFGDNSEIDLSGNSGIVRHDLERAEYSVAGENFVDHLRKNSMSIEQIMTGLNRLPVEWEMSNEELTPRPEVLENLKKYGQEIANQRQIPQKWISLRVTGNSQHSLTTVGDFIGSSGNVTANVVLIELDNGISWEIRGRIYEF